MMTEACAALTAFDGLLHRAAGDWAGAAVKKAINAVNEAQAAIIIGAGAAAAVVRSG